MDFTKAIIIGFATAFAFTLIFLGGMIVGGSSASPNGWFCTVNNKIIQLRPDDIIDFGNNTSGIVIKKSKDQKGGE